MDALTIIGILGPTGALLLWLAYRAIKKQGSLEGKIEVRDNTIEAINKVAEVRNEMAMDPKKREKIRDKYDQGEPE